MTELPAAHSMDTYWFGVDDAGEVAFFDTGEPGARPLEASDFPDGEFELIERLEFLPDDAPIPSIQQIIGDARSGLECAPPPEHVSGSDLLIGEPRLVHDLLLLIRSADSLETARTSLDNSLGESRGAVIRCSNGLLLFGGRIIQRNLDRLILSGACLDWWPWELRADACGVHHYKAEWRGVSESAAYIKRASPVVALGARHVQAILPPEFKMARFPGVRFAAAAEIRPCDSFACSDYYGPVKGTPFARRPSGKPDDVEG